MAQSGNIRANAEGKKDQFAETVPYLMNMSSSHDMDLSKHGDRGENN